MVLLTVAGRYAGELRDYSFEAGTAALRSGTARRVEAETPRPSAPPSQAKAQAGKKKRTSS